MMKKAGKKRAVRMPTKNKLNIGFGCIGLGVCFYCHDGHGRFIMDRRGKKCRDEQGRWEIGGGEIEFGSDIEETLKREVMEEYTTVIRSFVFLGFRNIIRIIDGKISHWIMLDFKVLVDPKTVSNGEPHKFDAVEWFTLNHLPSPTHSQFQKFLKKYKDQLQ